MKRPDYLDDELPAKIKVKHLTMSRKYKTTMKQKWAKPQGMVRK